MKKVVFATSPPEKVIVTQASPNKYYGYLNGEVKGFISRDDYRRGPYRARSLNLLTMGNCLGVTPTDSLVDLIIALLGLSIVVFEFDTDKELIRWLAQ